MPLASFHPVVRRWFSDRFDAPSPPQRQGWPAIASGEHTLIAAPTGSGKTLSAFLACLDRLLREALVAPLPDEVRVIYVSPLRALSNDMHRNLEEPLAELLRTAEETGYGSPVIRCGLRTGDTPQSQRQAMVRKPPHILVTTPESLYLMLTAERARETLATVEVVIVDEIHAMLRDKRGSHLALTLERLEAVTGRRLQRIGLSATQKPLSRVARFLVGQRGGTPVVAAKPDRAERRDHELVSITTAEPSLFSREELDSLHLDVPVPSDPNRCRIVEVDHRREFDLGIETPPGELGTICSTEQWSEVDFRLVDLIKDHRSTLIFVNTRRMAERLTHELTELLGEEIVGSHHGSLAAKTRLQTEQRLKSGEYRAVVATASLELGIDIGYVDLVIQMGSPRSLNAFLQRVGRSGHSLGLTPKGRIFALTRDDLLEAMALVRGVRCGALDTQIIPEAPLDVLAQQIVAEVAAADWDTDELYQLVCRADPYRELPRRDFDQIVTYLSEGVTEGQTRDRTFLHHDQVNRRLRARRGARLTAMINGGAIPEIASYRVVTEPDGQVVGTLDEHFAVETQKGDVFLLGNNSWRILGIRGTDMMVADAEGAPPTLPFWEGEAPGRSLELSAELSDLREELSRRVTHPDVIAWLRAETTCSNDQARAAVDYIAVQKAALGLVPTQKKVVFERFFDESGGMQLVVHAPFGMPICKAWGFAMRKRFCRSFDFELQATAEDNGFILSLGPQHSFPIESLFPMLTAENCRGLLEQAMFQIPLFQVRWRWNVTRSLLVERMRNGKKVPPALQRFRADDLLTAVFPKLTGCQEEHMGDHELPDHPLTRQTMEDCLREAMNLPGLCEVLQKIAAGEIELIARETREPSPFAYQLLGANPYAFLDGGEAQERRARAVATRQTLDAETLSDLGRLDLTAIQRVRAEAAAIVRSPDELHDVLLSRIVLPSDEAPEWEPHFHSLTEHGRAGKIALPDGRGAWVATERLPAALAIFPDSSVKPDLRIPESVRRNWDSVSARMVLVRGLLETSGPVTASEIAVRTALPVGIVTATLEAIEGEGHVMRGHYTPLATSTQFEGEQDQSEIEWCHRRLLSRIHRETLSGLRKQIKPVEPDAYLRFLFRHHGLSGRTPRAGANGLFETVAMLQGIDCPAICWERDLLPARLREYDPAWLDELCLTGEVGWGRLFPKPRTADEKPAAAVSRVAPLSIWIRTDLPWLTHTRSLVDETLSEEAAILHDWLRERGAKFANELIAETRLTPKQVSATLGELVARGRVTADGFTGLRHLIREKTAPKADAGSLGLSRTRKLANVTGRWSAFDHPVDQHEEDGPANPIREWAWQLLRRWGVVFKDLLQREQGAPNWYELLQHLRKMEARGEIRGGRFIAGVAGEQFAMSETIKTLRQQAEPAGEPELICLSAADPACLHGIIGDGRRVPATAANSVVYENGVAIAAIRSGEVEFLRQFTCEEQNRLLAFVSGELRSNPAQNNRPRTQTSVRLPRSLGSTAEKVDSEEGSFDTVEPAPKLETSETPTPVQMKTEGSPSAPVAPRSQGRRPRPVIS